MSNIHSISTSWPNQLRALATIAVILIHVVAPALANYGAKTNAHWWYAQIIDASMRWCVPVFLMLSGALLLHKTDKPLSFYQKRLQRILWPFLFWNTVYIINFLSFKGGFDLSFTKILNLISTLLKNGISYHLWYIYFILLLYFAMPWINPWIVRQKNWAIIALLAVWLCITQLSLGVVDRMNSPINLKYFMLLAGFPLLGYYLSERLNSRDERKIGLVLLFIGTLSTIVLTYVFTKSTGQFYKLFYLYVSPTVLLAAIGIFLTAKHINLHGKYLTPIFHLISEHSYGIYLSHVFVLFWLGKWGLNWKLWNIFWGVPLTVLATLCVSTALVFVLRKLPLGKYFAG